MQFKLADSNIYSSIIGYEEQTDTNLPSIKEMHKHEKFIQIVLKRINSG